MQKQIYKNNLRLNYRIKGNGEALVLIHGFLESSMIWDDFANELSEDFKIISIDLPGHAGSELYEKPYTMCKYAESVLHIMNEENIEKGILIGHSMGGYVSLAFAENYPERLSGICLFHSSPFADSEQKKESRNQLILDTEGGKKDHICEQHITQTFANENIQKFKKVINDATAVAKKMTEGQIISSVSAMRDRKDRSELLKNCTVPFLYILGLKDNFIPVNILELIDMPKKSKVLILENSGHMGMYEEKEKCLEGIRQFYKDIITT